MSNGPEAVLPLRTEILVCVHTGIEQCEQQGQKIVRFYEQGNCTFHSFITPEVAAQINTKRVFPEILQEEEMVFRQSNNEQKSKGEFSNTKDSG